MATAVISDLHLGAPAGNDLLRRPPVREHLFGLLQGVDRVVLLGDVVELRHGPPARALEEARPFFEELGEALGGPEVVVVPGNHDHQLAAGPLKERDGGAPLGLDWSHRPASGPLAEIARALRASGAARGAELELRYPGVWLAPRVYATHGHYLDWHNTVPALESLAASASARLSGVKLRDSMSTEDYEAAVAPVYGLIGRLAQSDAATRRLPAGGASVAVWKTLSRDGDSLRARVLRDLAIPGAVSLLNLAGLGPLEPEISGPRLRRAALEAMSEVAERLRIEADHLIFGHTHRPGPLPGDDHSEWVTPTGTQLVNCGSWMYEPAFLGETQEDSPHWPGAVVLLSEENRPELRRLLADQGHEELRG